MPDEYSVPGVHLRVLIELFEAPPPEYDQLLVHLSDALQDAFGKLFLRADADVAEKPPCILEYTTSIRAALALCSTTRIPIARSTTPRYTGAMDAVQKLRENGVRVDLTQIAAIARAFFVQEISVFGSSVRDDIAQESDIDLLVTFREGSAISLFDLMELEERLSELFGRPVDIVEPDSLENPIRRQAILSTKQRLYAA